MRGINNVFYGNILVMGLLVHININKTKTLFIVKKKNQKKNPNLGYRMSV